LANLTLPIPSPVSLEILAMPMRVLIDDHIDRSPLRARCRNALLGYGLLELPLWYFLAFPVKDGFLKIGGIGKGTADLINEAIVRMGGPTNALGSFEKLWTLVDAVSKQGSFWERHSPRVLLAVVAGSVSGYDHFISNPNVIALLAANGLRPGMPPEELFVYVPTGEPKKLTVAEEIMAFGAMQAVDVLPAASMEDLPEGITMLEVMMILAVTDDMFGWGSLARDRFVEAARKHISSEALAKLEVFSE
jgi:hypothetical protein